MIAQLILAFVFVVHQTSAAVSAPSRVHRLRTSLVGYKQESRGLVNDFYNFRASWTEPDFWNDDETATDRRAYDLNCWLEMNGVRQRDLVLIAVSPSFQGYNEKYQFPDQMDLYIQCGVRARNSQGFTSDWTYSGKIRVQEVPIFMAGFDGMNVRGFSKEDLAALRAKIAASNADADADAKSSV